MDEDRFTPLTDTYKRYTKDIEDAIKEGLFETYDTAQDIIWPWNLYLADSEKEDINDFLLEVTTEIISTAKKKGLTPKVVASYIFKTLISGMLLEKQRIGN